MNCLGQAAIEVGRIKFSSAFDEPTRRAATEPTGRNDALDRFNEFIELVDTWLEQPEGLSAYRALLGFLDPGEDPWRSNKRIFIDKLSSVQKAFTVDLLSFGQYIALPDDIQQRTDLARSFWTELTVPSGREDLIRRCTFDRVALIALVQLVFSRGIRPGRDAILVPKNPDAPPPDHDILGVLDGQAWETLRVEDLLAIPHFGRFNEITPYAFRYYLPAWLTMVLKQAGKEDSDELLYTLTASLTPLKQLAGELESKTEVLSCRQVGCIVLVFQHLADYHSVYVPNSRADDVTAVVEFWTQLANERQA